jgi:hypothetical protein
MKNSYPISLNDLKASVFGAPDYNNMSDPISTTEYKVGANGYVCTLGSAEKCTTTVKVNGKNVGVIGGWDNTHGLHMFLPVSAGDIVTFSASRSMVFIPCK